MFKVKIRNVDVLPYILIFLNVSLFTVFQLSVRNFFKIEYEDEVGVFTFILFMLSMLNYIKKIHTPKNVLLSELVSTEDIRTPTFKYEGFINIGNEISFVKFYFSEEAIYLYYRNFFPVKIYNGPLTINLKNTNQNGFKVLEFKKISPTEAKITISSTNGFTVYTFYMKDISKNDFALLEKKILLKD